MNCAQALAIAAGALVMAGDPCAALADARIELAALTARGQAAGQQVLRSIVAEFAAGADRRCDAARPGEA
jgi:hypothetical protein